MASRLAVLFYSIEGQGIERVILNLLTAWQLDGLNVDLVLVKGGGSNLKSVPSGTRVIELGATSTAQQVRKPVADCLFANALAFMLLGLQQANAF